MKKKDERNRYNDMNFKDESMLSQLHICLGRNATSDKEVIEFPLWLPWKPTYCSIP